MALPADVEMAWSPNWRFCLPMLIAAKRQFAAIPRTRKATESWTNRDGTKQVREFFYADRNDILGAVLPPLWDHGFDIHQTVVERAIGAVLVSTLMHSTGEWLRSTIPLPRLREAGGPHEVAGQLTQHYRYGLTPLLQIVTEETVKAGADLGVREEIAPPRPQKALGAPTPAGVRDVPPATAAGTASRVRAARGKQRPAESPPPAASPEPQAQAPGGAPPPVEDPPPPPGGGIPEPMPVPADTAQRVEAHRTLMARLTTIPHGPTAKAATWLAAAPVLRVSTPTEIELLFDHYVSCVGEAPPAVDGVTYPVMPPEA